MDFKDEMNNITDEKITQTEQVAEPVTEPITEPVTEQVVEPVVENTVEPVVEPVRETVNNSYNYDAYSPVYRQNADNGGDSSNTTETAGSYTEPPRSNPKKPKKEHKGIKKVFATIGLGIIFGLSAAAALVIMNDITGNSMIGINKQMNADEYKQEIKKEVLKELENSMPKQATSLELQGTAFLPETQVMDVSRVVDAVMPSAVSIRNTYTVTTSFFGRTFSEEEEASGSGIIIGENDEELLIATNNHVVDGADSLYVQFIDGKEVQAYVKGTDATMDLAVVAVEFGDMDSDTKNAIVIAQLGDSDALKVGEPAIAIGNALGYGQSVTAGVISAVDKILDIEDGSTARGLIQTDAAINPGNSGGALLNKNGEVVGINSNKIGGSAIEGMGYAIPISKALPILDELKVKKTKNMVLADKRGYLGISGRGVTAEVAETYGFPEGVFVYEVYEGTGAYFAGLQKGDIIIKMDGGSIRSMEELQNELSYYNAGEKVTLTIMRSDETGVYKEQSLEVVLISEDDFPRE